MGVVALLVVLLSLSGGSSPSTGTGAAARSTSTHGHGAGHTHGGSAVASPAETHVVVLNATEATGLAHKLSGNLQQSGYTQSAALSERPPSERSTSVVEYASGHLTEAQHVSQTLGISELAPLESAISPLVGGATVVVIAGADKASLVGSSTGASSTGASNEGAAANSGEANSGEAQSGAAAQNGGEAPAGGEASAATGQ